MRTLLVLATLALAAPALPLATAAHVGPCWHEYIEAAIEGAKRPKEAASILLGTVSGCLTWTPCDNIDCRRICETMDPCLLPLP